MKILIFSPCSNVVTPGATLKGIHGFRFIDGRASYYELGGVQRKRYFWNVWCQQVESLRARKVDRSSLSETSAASSSSTSTLYILSSEVEVRKGTGKQSTKTLCRVWAHYGGAGDYAPPNWPRKDLYLGPSHEELTNGRYAPVPVRYAGASFNDVKDNLDDHSASKVERPSHSWPFCHSAKNPRKWRNTSDLCDVLFIRDDDHRHCSSKFFTCQSSPCNNCQMKVYDDKESSRDVRDRTMRNRKFCDNSKGPSLARKVSRFGFGVPEKCSSGLILGPCRMDRDYNAVRLKYTLDPYALIESGVKVWEGEGKGRCKSSRKCRHLRRYGVCTAAHFLHALGPWSVQPGERDFFQGRRSFSLVTIRRQPNDSELKLPVSRRQLGASVSSTALEPGKFGAIGTTTRGRVVLFWTPDYWYRPRPASTAYRELRQHLNLLRSYRQEKESQSRRKLFYKRKKYPCEEKDSCVMAEEKPSLLGRIFSGNASCKKNKKEYERQESSTIVQLRRLLRMDFRITIWDLESTTLAEQLTLIDRDLFTRIPAEEIQILIFQKTARNAPNLGAWIAFSHRVSCLTVSEILAVRKLEMRTRILARYINVANKCFAIGNFHSCRSILAGLQAPPIYRLATTWSYLRTHHATRYEAMEKLCKTYKSPCTLAYQRAWTKAERKPPYMPYVGDLLTRLLGLNDPKQFVKLPQTKNDVNLQRLRKVKPIHVNKKSKLVEASPNLRQKDGLGKRIFLRALTTMKLRVNPRVTCEERKNLLWTSRQQDLARKYFYRWNNSVLKSRIIAKEEERLRNMDPTQKRILDVASWLTDCQRVAQGYVFQSHSFAREFLLKARYKEDRENFSISLKLEPVRIT